MTKQFSISNFQFSVFRNFFIENSLRIVHYKIKNYIGLLVVLVCIIGGSIFVPRANAQQPLDLTISPAVIEVTVNPGNIISQKFRIRNNTNSPLPLSITIDKLDALSGGQVSPIAPPPGDNSPSWFHFQNMEFTAAAQEWAEIPFTISIPKDAAFGYYFAIRIGQSTANKLQTPGANIRGEVILPLLVTVNSPNTKRELQLISFKTASFVNEYLPVEFAVTFKNTGNIYAKPQGNIFIHTDSSDNDIQTIDINPSLGAILPTGTRTYLADWTDGFLVQQGNQVIINWDRITHFRLGRYTATLLAVYDNGKRDIPIEATTTFWVFPYHLIASCVVGVMIVLIVMRFLLKWYIHQELKKHQK